MMTQTTSYDHGHPTDHDHVDCEEQGGSEPYPVLHIGNTVIWPSLVKRPFLWRTMEGEVLTLSEMKTSHMFNSMKMVFNHLAEEFKAEPVWFVHTYRDYQRRANHDPDALAYQVLTFIAEIEARGNLPEKYRVPYLLIKEQVFGPMKFKRIAAPRKEIA